MKLIVAIVQQEDAGDLVDVLTRRQYRATRINTAGGFLKSGNATILVGTEDSQAEEILSLIRTHCRARTRQLRPIPPITEPGEFYLPYAMEVEVGGATVFMLEVERHERL